MFFRTSKSHNISSANQVTLQFDDWDDWFEFSTLFQLAYCDPEGLWHRIGAVKIGQFNMVPKQRSPEIPTDFDMLDERFFSLGQDVSYYERLNNLGEEIRDKILSGLNDIALDSELYEKAIEERVTKISLFRSVTPSSIKGQFRRLAQGIVELSHFEFVYTAPVNKGSIYPPLTVTFKVRPESNPPSNIHVIIGRNAVGKTHLLNNMIKCLLSEEISESKNGFFTFANNEDIFANLVFVTFSAFDDNDPLPERKDKTKGIQFSYIGLKRVRKGEESSQAPKSPRILKNEFVKSVEACRRGSKNERWKNALQILESDPIFREAEIANIAEILDETEFISNASSLFDKLSSGHKVVLLSITRLIESVEEKSLVLIDEPEAHLHPPLLSAFIRALSILLTQRNGVAIIATHSPVVLQEVPKSCIWKLRRSGFNAIAERLELESFGENVGILTREVFGLEVTYSGFHKLLSDKVQSGMSYDEILEFFNNELGMESKAIIRTLIHQFKTYRDA